MELLELQDQVVVQEQMDLVALVLPQDHQVEMVHQLPLDQVEVVEVVGVMVQKVHLDPQEQVLLQVLQQAQVAQELLLHLEAQELLVIDIEHLLQVN
jgi:hypothetical protein